MKVLVAGELNPDLIFSGLSSLPQPGLEILASDFALRLGSSSAILAAGMAKLGNEVSLIAKVGADLFGRFILEQLRREGVDGNHVIVEDRLKTGVTVSITAKDRALMTYCGAIAELEANDVSSELLGQFRHLHVSSFYLQKALQPGLRGLFGRARRMGLTTSFDPGCDPSGQWSRDALELLEEVDVFLLNQVELESLTGAGDVEKGMKLISNFSPRTLLVVKLGLGGCAALGEEGVMRAAAIQVDAMDTTGAGDSLNAGFLHAWLRNMPLADCLRIGVICGGLSTRALGGTASQPSWQEVEQLWVGEMIAPSAP
jgi:sugar/nucleoside kinase (ribokinase family)